VPDHRQFFLAALILAPAVAGAQFTTFIPPEPKAAETRNPVKPVVASTHRARVDTASRPSVTSLKIWVDSAAQAAGMTSGARESRPRVRPDSGAASTIPPRSDAVAVGREAHRPRFEPVPTERSGGMRAPETASGLPALTLTGVIALVLGAFLLGPSARRHRA
jgi:hypothetical protein